MSKREDESKSVVGAGSVPRKELPKVDDAMNDDFDDTNMLPRITEQSAEAVGTDAPESSGAEGPEQPGKGSLPEFTPTGEVHKPNVEEPRRATLVPDGTAALVNPPTEILAIPTASQRAQGQASAVRSDDDLSGVRAEMLTPDGVEHELFGPGVPVRPAASELGDDQDVVAAPIHHDTSKLGARVIEPTDGKGKVGQSDASVPHEAGVAPNLNDSVAIPAPAGAFVPLDPATQVIPQGVESASTLPSHGPAFPGAETALFAAPGVANGAVPGEDDAENNASKPTSHRKRNILIGAGLGIVVLAGLYAGAAFFVADRVPGGTTVAGVDISQQSADDAVKTLNTELKSKTSDPLELRMGDQAITLLPAESGLVFDAKATVDKVTGFSLVPGRLLAHIGGGDVVEPVTKVDTAKLDAAMQSASEALATEPVDGAVAFVEGAVVATPAQNGMGVDADKAKSFLSETWLTGKTPLELPAVETDPAITQAMVDAAVSGPAAALLSGPVTVQINDKPVELPPDAMAAHASFELVEGQFVLQLNGEELVGEVLKRTDKIGAEAVNASIKIENGAPVITGGQVGMSIDPAVLAQAVGTAASSTSDRTAVATMAETAPSITKESIEGLGIKEVVGTQSINLTSDAVRTKNLQIAASAVNGTLLMPGDTFSLCQKIDGATADKGYGAAGVISNGMHKNEVGGGLSQMATTLYGAAFYTGLEDVQHKAHSQYINRYPAGQEATLYCPTVDLKFKNNTKFGVLIQAWVADGQTHAAFWSTKVWDKIEAVPGARTNQTSPSTTTIKGPDCVPSSAGNGGFRIVVTRNFYSGGAVAQSDTVTTTYSPVHRVQCEP